MPTPHLLVVIAVAAATRAVPGQQTPAVHQVGAIVAKTTEPLGPLAGIHVLSTGRVVVNEVGNPGKSARVLLFDSTLTTFTALLDTARASARKYPAAFSTAIPFAGDSTVFYDPIAVALGLLDPNGAIARIMAPPFPPDAGYLTARGPAFDPLGRAVYRGGLPSFPRVNARGQGLVLAPDSTPIVRATPGGVAPETLAYSRTPKSLRREPFVTKGGLAIQRPVIDPFMVVDEWAMLRDGTIAIIRGQDYHIDWITPGGQRSSSAKLPFQWHRLTDSDKVVILDSVRGFNEAHPMTFGMLQPGGARVSDVAPAGVIAPDSLADYRPPFARGAMVADADDNVWILSTPEKLLSSTPGPVYDVVNRAGKLIDRVQLSPGFGIVGFSPGYVFMSIREDSTTVIAKAKIR